MDCTRYEELISAALDGELSAGERRELDRHLAECPACAALFNELGAQCAALRELDCPFPDGLHDRILENLPGQDAAPAKPPVRKAFHWRRWAAVAACLVLVMAAAVRALPMLPGRSGGSAPTSVAGEPMADGAVDEGAFGRDGELPEGGQFGSYVGSEDAPAQRSGASPETVEDDGAMNEKNAEPAPVPYAAQVDGDAFAGEPEHYWFANDQYLRVAYSYTPEPGARIIGNTQSLEEFLEQFPFDGLLQLLPQYDEAYFETGRLLAAVVEEPSGSIRHQILPQGLLRDQVTIVQTGPYGTEDMAAWLILAEVDTMFDDGDGLAVTVIPYEEAEP